MWKPVQGKDGTWRPLLELNGEQHEIPSAWFETESECARFIAGIPAG